MRRLASHAFVALLLVGTAAAQAVEWPARAVRIVVPFGPGSTPDVLARIVAEKLHARLGQPFVVETKTGAGGNLGTDAVAKAEPDGYTLGISIVGPLVLNPLLFPRMPYDPARDLLPIVVLGGQPGVLVVNKDVPARNVGELLALLRSEPDRYDFGSIGVGSLSHLAMEAIAAASGRRLVHIPFAGSPAVVTALLRGDVKLAVLPAGGVVPQAVDGQLRLLAITLPERSPLLPDLPTLKEAGIENVEADAWVGLIAPARLPPEIAGQLGDAVRAILAEPDTRAKFQVQLVTVAGGSADDFRARMAAELARWAPVIRANDIRIGP